MAAKKSHIKRSNPASKKQEQAVRLALRLAPTFSYAEIGRRFGLTARQVEEIAKIAGLRKGHIGLKPAQRYPSFCYFGLIYKLDNYQNKSRTAIFREEDFRHGLKYGTALENFFSLPT